MQRCDIISLMMVFRIYSFYSFVLHLKSGFLSAASVRLFCSDDNHYDVISVVCVIKDVPTSDMSVLPLTGQSHSNKITVEVHLVRRRCAVIVHKIILNHSPDARHT